MRASCFAAARASRLDSRALLRRAIAVVASEDTRVTSSLLRHLGIERKRLVSHHDHNLAESVPRLLALLADGNSVAVVSDAVSRCSLRASSPRASSIPLYLQQVQWLLLH